MHDDEIESEVLEDSEAEVEYDELSYPEEVLIMEHMQSELDFSLDGAFDPDEGTIVQELIDGAYSHIDPDVLWELYDSVLGQFEKRLDAAEHVVWNDTGCAMLMVKDKRSYDILYHRDGSAVTAVIGRISQKKFHSMSQAEKGEFILEHLASAFYQGRRILCAVGIFHTRSCAQGVC